MQQIFSSMGFLEDPADILIFFGRWHPIVVHLPIGFLLLAALAQLASRKPKFKPLGPFIPYVWALGAISAFFAVVFGYLLSLSGDYDPDTLFWHKWMGVGVLLFAIGGYYATTKTARTWVFSKWAFTLLTVVAIAITGHLGGNLTHGSTYLLEYAPNTIRSLAGMPPKTEPRKPVIDLDSAHVFLDMVLPILDNKCTSCHNEGKKKGKLKLTTYNEIMKGGEGGDVIIAGDVAGSELFRRITLPENHDDFMPSEGKRPLTDQEIDLIEWWITNGAPENGYITQMDPDKELIATAETFFGLDSENQFYGQKIEPADALVVDSLKRRGFILNRLMRDNYFLEANFSLSETDLALGDLKLLTKLKEQLIWLDLRNADVGDAYLLEVAELRNLVKLDLSGNAITDTGLGYLTDLKHLKTLNVYKTSVSDKGLAAISEMASLEKLYIWQTMVSSEGIERLKSSNPDLEIISERE